MANLAMSTLRNLGAQLQRGATPDATLFEVLDRALTDTRMRFVLAERSWDVGRSAGGEPDFVVRVADADFARRVLGAGNLGLAESYMDGGFTFEKGGLDGFLSALAKHDVDAVVRRDPRVLARVAALRVQTVLADRAHKIRLHYDVGAEVYEAFLDETMGYTCGYQKTPGDTLRQLQENKYDRIAEKVKLAAGDRLLDIGCGWGGLLIHAAQKYGARAHGVTLANEQAEFVRRRARALGVESLVSVEVGDYLEVRGTFDKIVSVEMIEHVPEREHHRYFELVDRLLARDGIGLVHFMGCVHPKNDRDPFVQKYIFPDSTHPHLSAILRELERHDLPLLDVENIARHYLPTTQAWYANFQANKHRLDPAKYDARFVRMYEYLLALYVAGCAGMVAGVFQVLFTKNYRKHLVPHRL